MERILRSLNSEAGKLERIVENGLGEFKRETIWLRHFGLLQRGIMALYRAEIFALHFGSATVARC